MNPLRLSLEPLHHRGLYCIAVRGRMDSFGDKVIRAFPGRQYSKTHGCWYIPFTVEALSLLTQKLSACQPVDVLQAFDHSPASEEIKLKIIQFPLPEGYHEQLIRKRYSEATVRTYESQMRSFLSYIHPKKIQDISDGLIKDFQEHLVSKRKVSISTQNTAFQHNKPYAHHDELVQDKT